MHLRRPRGCHRLWHWHWHCGRITAHSRSGEPRAGAGAMEVTSGPRTLAGALKAATASLPLQPFQREPQLLRRERHHHRRVPSRFVGDSAAKDAARRWWWRWWWQCRMYYGVHRHWHHPCTSTSAVASCSAVAAADRCTIDLWLR